MAHHSLQMAQQRPKNNPLIWATCMEDTRCKNIKNHRNTPMREKKGSRRDRNFRRGFPGECEMRGGGDPQIISWVFLFIILRWFYWFFQSSKTILFFFFFFFFLSPRNNFQKYFEVRELFLSNSGTTTKYFICNLSEIILRGWVASKEIVSRWGYSVFERILLKWAVTKSTSDLFFKIIYFGGSPSVFAYGSPHDFHIFTSSHPHILTSSHPHIFTSSHLRIFSSSHLHITSSHLLIFTSSHLHIFTSSHLHIVSASHLRILTSSHLRILTSSHLHILPSCSLALLLSCPLLFPSFLFLS